MARKKACETESSIFATKLRNIMAESGTTQQELADALSVKRQTISLYTTGQSKPDVEQLGKILNFFGVSADWFLGLTRDRKRIPSAVDEIGLSERAVSNLEQYAKSGDMMQTLNYLLESVDFSGFVAQISLYMKYINKEGPDSEGIGSAELGKCRDTLISHGFQVLIPEDRAQVHYQRAIEYLKALLPKKESEVAQNGQH